MRILFVCDYYPPHIGGAELVYRRYCEGLVKRGYTVDIITIRHSQDLLCNESVNGVAIHRIDTPWRSRHLFALFSMRRVVEYSKVADIIHCAFFVAPFSAIPVSKFKGKPLVVTIHEVWGKKWFEFESNLLRAIIDYLGERILTIMPYNAIICPSRYTLESLCELGVNKEKITHIPNGVELELFRPRPKDSQMKRELGLEGFKVYMFYGRPGISKGVKYIVRAAALIEKRIKNSKLLMILDKEPAREYRKILRLIDKLELTDHICLLDSLTYEELPKYVALADLVVVPSLSEGFGFTAAESAAMGKPVVASKVGSLPEIVIHEESGLLVKPRSPEEISKAVCKLLDNKEIAGKMGKNARTIVSRFNWKKALNQLEALYMKLLA